MLTPDSFLTDILADHIPNNIDPKWLAAFQEANKDFELIKPIEINLDEDSINTLNIPYSKEDNNIYQEIKEEDTKQEATEEEVPIYEKDINVDEDNSDINENTKSLHVYGHMLCLLFQKAH